MFEPSVFGVRCWCLTQAALFLGGCTCNWFAPSSQETREVDGVKVRLKAAAHRKIGVGVLGAPHVGGMLYPTMKGYGYGVLLSVEGRPEVNVFARGGFDEMVAPEVLARAVRQQRVKFSPDRRHLATSPEGSRHWLMLHLMRKGPPFPSYGSIQRNKQQPDFSGLKSPETIAVEILQRGGRGVMRNKKSQRGKLFWMAVEAQPAGGPLDRPLLDLWPRVRPARRLVQKRAEQGSGVTAAWRKAALRKAARALSGRQTRHACELIMRTGDAAAIQRMDDQLLARFPALEAHKMLKLRLCRGCAMRKVVARSWIGPKPPPSKAWRKRARARALQLLGRPPRTGPAAAQLLILLGDGKASARVLERLLQLWPQNKLAHTLLVRHARSGSEQWRARAREQAEGIEQGRHETRIKRLLRVLQ